VHFSNVYRKLGISSRLQLSDALAALVEGLAGGQPAPLAAPDGVKDDGFSWGVPRCERLAPRPRLSLHKDPIAHRCEGRRLR
jgi:hypothetical protein